MDLDIGGLMIGNGSDVLENKATLETGKGKHVA